ncbi:MAG: flagellar export chaperone FliS [Legionellales bacterium]|nr:flagellar export chaperone FliS [Legionellales bacterium]
MKPTMNTAYNQMNALEVEGASQHRMVQLLMQNVIDRLNRSKALIQSKNTPQKLHEMNRALEIVQTLNATLEVKAGVQVLENMQTCYEFLIQNIIKANAKNDLKLIDESIQVISELKQGWDSIGEIAEKMVQENK